MDPLAIKVGPYIAHVRRILHQREKNERTYTETKF